MSTEIDTRVTISLHPNNVEQIDGYDEETAPVLAPVVTAFDEAYLGIGRVHTARAAAAENPTWNEATQLIQVQDLSDKVFAKVAKAMDNTRANLERSIAHLTKEMTQPITARADRPGISSEIRQHVSKLPSGERMHFIKQAIEAGDTETCQSVLGAPSYLSGIDGNMQAVLTRMYHEKQSPAMAKRLKAMQGARDLIAKNGSLVLGELEKAVGARPDQVQRLRKAKTKAEQAFVLKDIG